MYNETTRLVKVVMPVDTEEDIQQGETNPILASVNPTRAITPSDPVGGGDIMLSDTAENLYIAYEVVAMVKDESTGKTHFSQLKWKKLGEIETDGGGDKPVADPSGDGDGEPIVAKGAMRDGSDTSDDDTSDDEPQLVYQFMFESGDLFVASASDEYPALDGDELQMLSDNSSSGGGSGGGVLVVHLGEGGVLDKTWGEIDAADVAVVAFSGSEDDETWHNREFVTVTTLLNGTYFVTTVYNGGSSDYGTNSADGYPVHQH